MSARFLLLGVLLSQLFVIPARADGCTPAAPPVVHVQEARARDGDTRIVARLSSKTTLCTDGSISTVVEGRLSFDNPSAGCGNPATITFDDSGAHAVSSGFACVGDITWVRTGDPPALNAPILGEVIYGATGQRQLSDATGLRYAATVTDGTYVFVTTPHTFSDAAAGIVDGISPGVCTPIGCL